jgi:uncharacterized integral membrane protein
MKFIAFVKKHKALTLLTLISMVVLIVLFQNSDSVKFKVLFWQFSAQKVIFILGAMVLGYIVGKLGEFSFRKRS